MNKAATLLFLCTALFAQQKGTFTDTRDGKIYKTTKIGEQVWMAENMSYSTGGSKCYGEGSKDIKVTEIDPYEDKIYTKTYKALSTAEIQANCVKYGKLYNWEMANWICPKGWHLPTKYEWGILTEAVDWNSGFSALPGGVGYSDGFFNGVGKFGYWWTSSEYGYDKKAYYAIVIGNNGGISYQDNYMYDLLSVRCLQDTPAPPKGEAK